MSDRRRLRDSGRTLLFSLSLVALLGFTVTFVTLPGTQIGDLEGSGERASFLAELAVRVGVSLGAGLALASIVAIPIFAVIMFVHEIRSSGDADSACPHCGNRLVGDDLDRCPECGEAIQRN